MGDMVVATYTSTVLGLEVERDNTLAHDRLRLKDTKGEVGGRLVYHQGGVAHLVLLKKENT